MYDLYFEMLDKILESQELQVRMLENLVQRKWKLDKDLSERKITLSQYEEKKNY
ncbi:MAG: hypothetical protein J1F67_11870 [Muribaculaceae bacterium]|nr:hypothetical protein [Muribaculaceae bacterium]